jgi:putative spermidine/putrescine transport system substrate-binding protein
MGNKFRKRGFSSLIILVVTCLLSLPLTNLAAEEKVLVVQTWGGAFKDAMKAAWLDPFSRQTGVKIITADETMNIAGKIKAQVMSNNLEWDIACGINLASVVSLANDNLIEPLDYSVIDTKDLFPEVVDKYGLGHHVLSDALVVNTKKFPGENYPRNWADFWNVKKFPGPRTLIGVASAAAKDNLTFALLADGVPKDKIYPYDLDRAFKKMDEIKPHIRAWWTSGAHSQQLFVDDEVWLGGIWNGRYAGLVKKGVPVRIVWEQATLAADYWVVLKNARNKKIAMEFINFASQAKPQAEYATLMSYGPVNKKAFENMPPEIAKDFPTHPDNIKKLFVQDMKWLGENQTMLTEKWQAWVSK